MFSASCKVSFKRGNSSLMKAAGCDLDVAFAVLRNVVVGNAVEDDAGTFRVGAGKGKVDDGAGFTFADNSQFVLDVFDGADAGELG